MFQIFKDPDFDFMRVRRPFVALSLVLMAASAVIVAARGINWGIEFTGGTELRLRYAADPDLAAIRGALQGAGLGAVSVTTIGSPEEREVYLRVGGTPGGAEDDETATRVVRALAPTGSFELRNQSYLGPVIGQELVRKAVLAIVGSLAGMLVYIAVRFEFRMGVAAVAALVHDTLVTLGLVALFQKELSLPVVAAFLTLIGYSVNDTVVIFDRVRENRRLRAHRDIDELIDASLNQTLSRTVLTSFLTWVMVLALFLFGGEALNPFSFVLVVGIVLGTYSTVFIACPVLAFWETRFPSRRREEHDAGKGDKPRSGHPQPAMPRTRRRVSGGIAR